MELRPRFKVEVEMESSLFCSRLQKLLEASGDQVKGTINENFMSLRIPEEEQHYWSPVLNLSVHPRAEGGSIVRGLMGPRPTVWLMFIFFYSFLGFVSMIVMVMGFSQLNLGLKAGILWLLPAILLIIGLMYASAQAGKRMAREQMLRLQQFAEQAIGKELEPVE